MPWVTMLTIFESSFYNQSLLMARYLQNLDGIKILWSYLFKLIESDFSNKTLCQGIKISQLLTTLSLILKEIIKGEHMVLISQEEGCDI